MTERHAIDRADVMAWIDGELSAARAAEIGAHVSSCASCRALADDLRQVSARLQRWDVDAPSGRAMPPALADALDRRAAPRRRSLPAWLRLSRPQWTLAAASLAGIALVATMWNPLADRASPPAAFEQAAADSGAGDRARVTTAPPSEPAVQPDAATPAGVGAPAPASASPSVAASPPPAAAPPRPAVAPPPASVPLPPSQLARPAASPPPDAVGETRVSGGITGDIQMLEAEAAADRTLTARAISLTLAVDDVPSVRDRLATLAADNGGAVVPPPEMLADAAARRSGGGRGGGRTAEAITLLVPAAALEQVMAAVRELGEVRNPIDSSVDLSEEFEKVAAAAATAREAETRAATAATAARGSAAAAEAGRQLDEARREASRLAAAVQDLEARADVVRLTIRIVSGRVMLTAW